MNQKNSPNGKGVAMRRLSRVFHRHLSFFFAGVICVYAISGICLNHKRDFNSNINIKRISLMIQGEFPTTADMVNKDALHGFVSQLPAQEQYTRHAAVGEHGMKVFFKGGSSLEVDLSNGEAVYEKVRKVPVFSSFNRLHYNPSRWWTVFSDVFAVSLLIITLTGFLMMKGRNGFWGIGGIEFAVGIIIPLLFIFFF